MGKSANTVKAVVSATSPPMGWNVEVSLNAVPFGYAVMQANYKRTIYFWGELDFAASTELMPKLGDLCGPTKTDVFLDLSRVEFIDSEGIKSLIALFEAVRVNGGVPRIARHSPTTSRTIQLSGMEKLFNSEGTSARGHCTFRMAEAVR